MTASLRSPRLLGVSLTIATLAGCAGSSTSDAGLYRRDAARESDASIDAALDAALDDSIDVGPDTDTGVAASTDASADTSIDAWSAPPVRFFDDVTSLVGVTIDRAPVDDYDTLPDRMSGGVCAIDVDGVAPMDLFFALRPVPGDDTQGSRLYVGTGPLAYTDRTTALGLGDVGDAWGCLAWDEDSDGDDDLLVFGVGTLRLFRNAGGTFSDVSPVLGYTPGATDALASATVGDADGDGDLDLGIGGFLDASSRFLQPEMCGVEGHVCAPNVGVPPPITNRVLVRGPTGSYTDRTATLVPDFSIAKPTLVLAFTDLDRDGNADLFECNDVSGRYADRAFLRRDETFVDSTLSLGLGTNYRGSGTNCMGWTSYDIDGNGYFDHVVTDFEQMPTAVHLCTLGTADTDAGAPFDAGPDDLYCGDESPSRGTHGWATTTFRWGAALVDLDLDGRIDLFESTGSFYEQVEVDAAAFLTADEYEPAHLALWNGARFVVPTLDPTDGSQVPRVTRGLTVTDLDDDGRPDVVLAPARGAPAVLHNVRERQGHFVVVKLVGDAPNRDAVGAIVEVETPSGTLRRERHVGEGYAGSFDRRLFFGVGDATSVTVRVRWPSGVTTVSSGHGVDTVYEVIE